MPAVRYRPGGRDRQSQGVKNQINGAYAVLLFSQLMDALGHGDFPVRRQRHAFFGQWSVRSPPPRGAWPWARP